MSYNTRKNWQDSLEFLLANPVIFVPFAVIGFLEGLALEILYFSSRPPISLITSPIVRKFFGEAFTHYPANFILMPQLFFYWQVVIYVFAGVFLTAIAINIYKNLKSNTPLTPRAMVNNAQRRYAAFMGFGIIMVALLYITKNIDLFVINKALGLVSGQLPNLAVKIKPVTTMLVLFLTNVVVMVFTISAVPLMVIRNRSLLKALSESFLLGLGNFLSLFSLLLAPFLLYLPINMMKGNPAQIARMISPEAVAYVTIAGIFVNILVDCFVAVCASYFVMDKIKEK